MIEVTVNQIENAYRKALNEAGQPYKNILKTPQKPAPPLASQFSLPPAELPSMSYVRPNLISGIK